MTYFILFFLGLVQGLTEFLPISSSGHLVLFSKLFQIEEELFLSILLHVATFLSIVVVFHKDIFNLLRHPFSKETINLVIATIPTCIVALLLLPVIKSSFGGELLPFCFMISAVLLLVTDIVTKNKKTKEINTKTALFIGFMQGLAVFPGISRSGTTIASGLIAGGDKKEVTKFSFLMSLPIIFLSMVMEIYEVAVGKVSLNLPIFALVISFLIAFLSGIFAIKFMMKLTENGKLKWFSVYLFMLSIVLFFVI